MPVERFAVTPTITAGAYSQNDVIGGLLTFTGCHRGVLQGVTIADKAKQSVDYLLVLFDDTPTGISDNATYAIADADLGKIIQKFDLTSASDMQSFSDNSIHSKLNLNVPIASGCSNLTGFLITTSSSAPTYASTSDITVTLQIDTNYVSGFTPGTSNIEAVSQGDVAGGELGGTYPSPTVNASHGGSSHANLPSGAQVNSVDIMDVSSTQTGTNKTFTSAVLNTGVSGTAVLDEDDMASDSSTQIATQQSIKAYVDSKLPSTVVKASTETVNNSTTLQNDDELAVAVLASNVYHFTLFIIASDGSTGGAADIDVAMSLPSGASGHWWLHDGGDATMVDCTAELTLGLPEGGREAFLLEGYLLTAGTAGTAQFQWAQNSAQAADLQVLFGSALTLEKQA